MKLYRAFATVGGLTMVSRILGFMRDILLARVFGTGPLPTPSSWRSASRTCSAACLARARSTQRSCRCLRAGWRARGRRRRAQFAEEAMAGLVFVLLLPSAICSWPCRG